MSVKARIEDALTLWNAGRKEGALVQALIAAAATARKRYPSMKDRQAFSTFIRDVTPVLLWGMREIGHVGFHMILTNSDMTVQRRLDDIFYKQMRCNLIHEGELKEQEVHLTETFLGEDGQPKLRLVAEPEGSVGIPELWIIRLLEAIKAAPENQDLFQPEGEETLTPR